MGDTTSFPRFSFASCVRNIVKPFIECLKQGPDSLSIFTEICKDCYCVSWKLLYRVSQKDPLTASDKSCIESITNIEIHFYCTMEEKLDAYLARVFPMEYSLLIKDFLTLLKKKIKIHIYLAIITCDS